MVKILRMVISNCIKTRCLTKSCIFWSLKLIFLRCLFKNIKNVISELRKCLFKIKISQLLHFSNCRNWFLRLVMILKSQNCHFWISVVMFILKYKKYKSSVSNKLPKCRMHQCQISQLLHFQIAEMILRCDVYLKI